MTRDIIYYYYYYLSYIWRRGMPFSLTKRSPTPRPGHTMSLGIGTIFYFSPLSTVVYVMTCTMSIPSTRTYLIILLLLHFFVALARAAHSFIIMIVIITAIIMDRIPSPSQLPRNGEYSVGRSFLTVKHDNNNTFEERWCDADDDDDDDDDEAVEWRESRSRDDRLICNKTLSN